MSAHNLLLLLLERTQAKAWVAIQRCEVINIERETRGRSLIGKRKAQSKFAHQPLSQLPRNNAFLKPIQNKLVGTIL